MCSYTYQGFIQDFRWGGGDTSQSYDKTLPFLGGSGGMLPQKIFEI